MAAEVDKPILPEAEGSLRSEIDYFQYKSERGDSPNNVRNALLVVATLIAAVTFQAGINPPDGVWHEITKIHVAEKWTTVYNNKLRFTIFLLSNTVAFSTSISIIGLLIRGFPGYFWMLIALLLMMITYGASIGVVQPPGVVIGVALYAALILPFILVLARHMWLHIKRFFK